MNKKVTLSKSPIVMGIFQLVFEENEDFNIKHILNNDSIIKQYFNQRVDNYQSHLGVNGTPAPGISVLQVKADTKIDSYTYTTTDKKKQLTIDKNSITYINEHKYSKWEDFKEDVMHSLKLIEDTLSTRIVERSSIRFINKFSFDTFDNPQEYFTKIISTSTSENNYHVRKYAFKLLLDIDHNTRAIVNHAIEPLNTLTDYMLDIDVLHSQKFDMNFDTLDRVIEHLHNIRNDIFFDSLTSKTIDLCN